MAYTSFNIPNDFGQVNDTDYTAGVGTTIPGMQLLPARPANFTGTGAVSPVLQPYLTGYQNPAQQTSVNADNNSDGGFNFGDWFGKDGYAITGLNVLGNIMQSINQDRYVREIRRNNAYKRDRDRATFGNQAVLSQQASDNRIAAGAAQSGYTPMQINSAVNNGPKIRSTF